MMPLQLSKRQKKLLVLFVVGLLYSLSIAYFFQSLPNARLTSDFFPRWHASRMLLTTGRSIYDWTNAVEVSEITGWPLLHQLGYYYPAYLLIFTAPLSLLPYGIAYIIWAVFGLWCLWISLMLLADTLLPDFSVNRLTLLLVLVTISVPVFQHTLYAQFNGIGLLALVLTYRALRRQHYFLAGLWAGGLLFKPQITLIPLAVFVMWTMFEPNRRRFWLGLGLISIFFWGVAEVMEPNWVITFWQSLASYERITSIVDKLWNPYHLVTALLLGFTLWLIFHLRHNEADTTAFVGLFAWSINLNALIVPMFGMMHMTMMGLTVVMLLAGFVDRYPALISWLWWGIIGLLIAGLLSFIAPLFLVGATGWQITVTEFVYRFSMPIIFCLISLLLIFDVRHRSKLTFNKLLPSRQPSSG